MNNIITALREMGYEVTKVGDGIVAKYKNVAIFVSKNLSYYGEEDYHAVSVDRNDIEAIISLYIKKNERNHLYKVSLGYTAYMAAMGNECIRVTRRGLLCNHDHSQDEILRGAQKMLHEDCRMVIS